MGQLENSDAAPPQWRAGIVELMLMLMIPEALFCTDIAQAVFVLGFWKAERRSPIRSNRLEFPGISGSSYINEPNNLYTILLHCRLPWAGM